MYCFVHLSQSTPVVMYECRYEGNNSWIMEKKVDEEEKVEKEQEVEDGGEDEEGYRRQQRVFVFGVIVLTTGMIPAIAAHEGVLTGYLIRGAREGEEKVVLTFLSKALLSKTCFVQLTLKLLFVL